MIFHSKRDAKNVFLLFSRTPQGEGEEAVDGAHLRRVPTDVRRCHKPRERLHGRARNRASNSRPGSAAAVLATRSGGRQRSDFGVPLVKQATCAARLSFQHVVSLDGCLCGHELFAGKRWAVQIAPKHFTVGPTKSESRT